MKNFLEELGSATDKLVKQFQTGQTEQKSSGTIEINGHIVSLEAEISKGESFSDSRRLWNHLQVCGKEHREAICTKEVPLPCRSLV